MIFAIMNPPNSAAPADLHAAASMSPSPLTRERLSLLRRPGKKSEVTLR